VIEVQDLTKRYGDVVAVDHASFTVRPGRVTGFLGPNGAGKSTTMRMVLGLDRPTAGRVLIGGRPYRELDQPLREIGALIDPAAVDGGRSVRDHLRWLARTAALGDRRVDEVLDLVGLGSAAGRRIAALSLGMRQRLGIAAALLGDPPVVMLDEPINGLDPDGIVWLRHLVHHLAGEGRTVFLSSHLMGEVAQVAQHLVVIGQGRILADAPLEQLLAGHAEAVRVRADDQLGLLAALPTIGATAEPGDDGGLLVTGADSRAIGRLAAAHGIALVELTPRSTSLEEAFFELTDDVTQYQAGDLVGATRGA
jgi:ABC-2 type transport system ATP-binding protein